MEKLNAATFFKKYYQRTMRAISYPRFRGRSHKDSYNKEISHETGAEIEPVKREYSLKKGLLLLVATFALTLSSVMYVANDYHQRDAMQRHIQELIALDLEDADPVRNAMMAFLWKIFRQWLIAAGAIVVFLILANGAGLISKRACKGQTLARIIKLRWPRAGAFLIWAAVAILNMISAILLFVDAVLVCKDLIKFFKSE